MYCYSLELNRILRLIVVNVTRERTCKDISQGDRKSVLHTKDITNQLDLTLHSNFCLSVVSVPSDPSVSAFVLLKSRRLQQFSFPPVSAFRQLQRGTFSAMAVTEESNEATISSQNWTNERTRIPAASVNFCWWQINFTLFSVSRRNYMATSTPSQPRSFHCSVSWPYVTVTKLPRLSLSASETRWTSAPLWSTVFTRGESASSISSVGFN